MISAQYVDGLELRIRELVRAKRKAEEERDALETEVNRLKACWEEEQRGEAEIRKILERVKADRAEYRDLADKWRDDWVAAMDSRDALAAHVETARGVMHRLIETERYMRGPRPQAVQEYLDWMDATPATSLARLKAEWQAGALQEIIDNLKRSSRGQIAVDDIKAEAGRYRRQAEGGTQ